jgi:hypothetical protein
MRTTVDIEEPLLRHARKRAAATNTTLSQIVKNALRAYLAAPARRSDQPFELVVRGTPGGPCPTPAEMARALEDEEVATLRIPGAKPRGDA